jgi:hypothetical protein
VSRLGELHLLFVRSRDWRSMADPPLLFLAKFTPSGIPEEERALKMGIGEAPGLRVVRDVIGVADIAEVSCATGGDSGIIGANGARRFATMDHISAIWCSPALAATS